MPGLAELGAGWKAADGQPLRRRREQKRVSLDGSLSMAVRRDSLPRANWAGMSDEGSHCGMEKLTDSASSQAGRHCDVVGDGVVWVLRCRAWD